MEIRIIMYLTCADSVEELYDDYKVDCCAIHFNCDEYFKCNDKYNPNTIIFKFVSKLQELHKKLQDAELVNIIKRHPPGVTSNLGNNKVEINFTCKKKGNGTLKMSYQLEWEDKKYYGDYVNGFISALIDAQRRSYNFLDPLHTTMLVVVVFLGTLVFYFLLYKVTKNFALK
ncbi:PIR Superfamily Protein [Plasmodium ovale wallikeri]|uniref:PIR Superfamily Protein n=2 Tax=Plasmodium ovale TaxID=36330 RepID=A0A1A9AQ13_PLAOA|nr:PIR Superfamily Protein [Plasmodium ovale wallikeri]SBT58725.1 PIR Superfamily Protein [Plasmodium ovale wallikeri]SBT74011.1 Plasmodium vivax Vir protein, putative [Plasmodium ovale]